MRLIELLLLVCLLSYSALAYSRFGSQLSYGSGGLQRISVPSEPHHLQYGRFKAGGEDVLSRFFSNI